MKLFFSLKECKEELINANVSDVGFNRSFGVMVNYLYELKNIEKNHERPIVC